MILYYRTRIVVGAEPHLVPRRPTNGVLPYRRQPRLSPRARRPHGAPRTTGPPPETSWPRFRPRTSSVCISGRSSSSSPISSSPEAALTPEPSVRAPNENPTVRRNRRRSGLGDTRTSESASHVSTHPEPSSTASLIRSEAGSAFFFAMVGYCNADNRHRHKVGFFAIKTIVVIKRIERSIPDVNVTKKL